MKNDKTRYPISNHEPLDRQSNVLTIQSQSITMCSTRYSGKHSDIYWGNYVPSDWSRCCLFVCLGHSMNGVRLPLLTYHKIQLRLYTVYGSNVQPYRLLDHWAVWVRHETHPSRSESMAYLRHTIIFHQCLLW